MRTKLTKMLSIRQVPFLRFHADEQLKKEMAVLELIDKAARDRGTGAEAHRGIRGRGNVAPNP